MARWGRKANLKGARNQMAKKTGYSSKKGLSRTRSMGSALSNDLGVNPTGNISVNGIGGGPGSGRGDAAYSKSNLYSHDTHPGKTKKVGMSIKKGTLKKGSY